MDKKVTRRVAIGTAIAGLVAGPFVIRRLRKTVPIDSYSENLLKLAANAQTDMSPDEVLMALEVFSSVRDQWLSIKEFSAKSHVDLEIHNNLEIHDNETNQKIPQKIPFQWNDFLSFRVVDSRLPSETHKGRLWYNCELSGFSNDEKDIPLWTFKRNRNSLPEVISKNPTTSFLAAWLGDMFFIPFEIFLDYWHTNEEGILHSGTPYSFGTEEKNDKDNSFRFMCDYGPITWFFKDGFFYKHEIKEPIGDSAKNHILSLNDYVSVDNIYFPSNWKFFLKTVEKNIISSVVLTDIKIKSIPYHQ